MGLMLANTLATLRRKLHLSAGSRGAPLSTEVWMQGESVLNFYGEPA